MVQRSKKKKITTKGGKRRLSVCIIIKIPCIINIKIDILILIRWEIVATGYFWNFRKTIFILYSIVYFHTTTLYFFKTRLSLLFSFLLFSLPYTFYYIQVPNKPAVLSILLSPIACKFSCNTCLSLTKLVIL